MSTAPIGPAPAAGFRHSQPLYTPLQNVYTSAQYQYLSLDPNCVSWSVAPPNFSLAATAVLIGLLLQEAFGCWPAGSAARRTCRLHCSRAPDQAAASPSLQPLHRMARDGLQCEIPAPTGAPLQVPGPPGLWSQLLMQDLSSLMPHFSISGHSSQADCDRCLALEICQHTDQHSSAPAQSAERSQCTTRSPFWCTCCSSWPGPQAPPVAIVSVAAVVQPPPA